MWCDACMEAMYNTARDEQEHEAELQCPQCRKSVGEMQIEARKERVLAAFECSDENACLLLMYENLLSELIRLCVADEDGLPFYTVPREAAARILSRDVACDIVLTMQGGSSVLSRLTRLLRATDYAGAVALVLRGYVGLVRVAARQPAMPSEVLEGVARYVRTVQAGGDGARAAGVSHKAALLASVEALLATSGKAALPSRGDAARGRAETSNTGEPRRAKRRRR